MPRDTPPAHSERPSGPVVSPLIYRLMTEMQRQDEKHGKFEGTMLGRSRLAIACLEDEVAEAREAWRSERKALTWDHTPRGAAVGRRRRDASAEGCAVTPPSRSERQITAQHAFHLQTDGDDVPEDVKESVMSYLDDVATAASRQELMEGIEAAYAAIGSWEDFLRGAT